jgi:hypothetical protein
MDWNKSGAIEAQEAKVLCERARLDNDSLSLAWEHADCDRDGQLVFPEFVALIHLISCLKKGAPLPSLQEGLPPELFNALANLNGTPEELAAQRSRSASPSGAASPNGLFATSRSQSPAPPYMEGNEWQSGEWAQPPPAGDAFATGPGPVDDTFGQAQPWAAVGLDINGDGRPDVIVEGVDRNHDGIPDVLQDGFGDKKSKKHKKDKKDKRHEEFEAPTMDAFSAPPPDFGASAFGPDASDGFRAIEGSHDRGFGYDIEHERERENSRRYELEHDRERERDYATRQHDVNSATHQFSAIIEADHAVSRQLRAEVDKLEEELRHLRDAHNRFDEEVRRERQQCESMAAEKRRLEQQLQEAKYRLDALRDDRRAINLESISLRRDRDHISHELAFLQKMAREEEITLECLHRTNTDLEKSYRSMEGQTEQLERERRHLIEQVTEERRLVQGEERQNAEIRTKLERLRREQVAANQSRRQEFEREQRRDEMQNGMENPSATAARRGEPLPRSGHSWAGIIASESVGPSASPKMVVNTSPAALSVQGARSSLPARPLVATGPAGREGV